MQVWNTTKHYLRSPYHTTKSHIHAIKHGYPAQSLKIIAVTGTDGKTTTATMIFHMLKSQGLRVGLASTVYFSLPSKGLYRNKTKMTSLPPAEAQNFFKDCIKEDLDYVVVEASSVALHQQRFAGMSPFIACLTNITREELAYHRTMKHYEKSKRRIMYRANHAVLPPNFKHWKNGDTQISHYDRDNIPMGTLQIEGDYNYDNAAIAYEVGKLLEIKDIDILRSLESYEGVVGRMERVEDPEGRHVFVDYAVTPAAFEAVYKSLKRNYPQGKLIHVFGATGGGRDAEKRPLLGKLASEYCDTIILTDEESYGEPVTDILDQIELGIIDTFEGKVLRIEDRMKALEKAIEISGKGDILLATGMGGELSRNTSGEGDSVASTTKKMGGVDIPWEEEKILADLVLVDS